MPVNSNLWKIIGYEPHEKQVLFHQSKARFKVPVCGRRFGKSRMAAAEVMPYLFDRENPGRGWIIGPTYQTAEEEFRYLWDDIILKMNLKDLVKRKAYNTRTGEMYIEMVWGSRVEVKSAQHPDTLVGKGLRWAILSEAAKLPEEVWLKYLRPALADYRAPAIFPSTPEGYNWFHRIYMDGQKKKDGEWESWNFPAWENPYIYPAGFDDPEIQNQRSADPDDPWFWQELGAKFTSVVGLIYPEWNKELHVDEWKYNPSTDNYLFMDFGFTNPFVALDVQITPTDEVHVWREYYHRQKPTHQHVRELKMRGNPEGYKILTAYGDAADPSSVEEVSRNLVHCIAKAEAKDMLRGIRLVKKFLRPVEMGSRPKLFVHKDCVNTIQEFEEYKMKGTRSMGEDPKEEPRKKNDHSLDAIRYGLMHLYDLGLGTSLESILEMSMPQKLQSDSGLFTYGEADGRITMGSSF